MQLVNISFEVCEIVVSHPYHIEWEAMWNIFPQSQNSRCFSPRGRFLAKGGLTRMWFTSIDPMQHHQILRCLWFVSFCFQLLVEQINQSDQELCRWINILNGLRRWHFFVPGDIQSWRMMLSPIIQCKRILQRGRLRSFIGKGDLVAESSWSGIFQVI